MYLLKWRLFPIFIALTLLISQPIYASNEPGMTSYEETFQQLMDLTPVSVAQVENLTLNRDAATFHLNTGELYLLSQVNGRTVGAYFSGSGLVDFVPSTRSEQEQLARFFEVNSIHKKMNNLFILFGDSTYQEINRYLQFTPIESKRTVRYAVTSGLKYISDKKSEYFRTSIMKTFLENKSNSMFFAQFSQEKSDPLFFSINPYEVEEITLERRVKDALISHNSEIVSQFHKKSDYKHALGLMNENKSRVKITHYTIHSDIDRGLHYSATASLQFRELVQGQKWWVFDLYSGMEIDSACWSDNTPVIYHKKKEDPTLWIENNYVDNSSPNRKLTLYYHGDLISEKMGWYLIKSSIGWYPRTGVREKALFDLTFTYPNTLTLVSVGKLQGKEDDGKYVTSHWVTDDPIRNASFNIGYYKEYSIDDDRIPEVTVLMAKTNHTSIGVELAQEGILSGKNMDKQVGADIANSIYFFQQMYGPTPVQHFYATEAPHFHGEAFPGLIHLSWETFQVVDNSGNNPLFRAHEVAHQWWGIGVDFKTYHDQWLSEGLADFSGLWYLQSVYGDQELFLNILDDWKKKILSARKYLIGNGQESGPIWMGYRTQSSTTSGDYDLIIYKKGAWIFQMLRNMMMDLKKLDDSKFQNMMHEFYITYQGRKASTEDFQRIVSRYFNQNMDWFFDQWVYNVAIPKYHFSYKKEKNQDGTWEVYCRVREENVPESFKMSIPIKLDFGKDRFARVRIFVNKPDYTIKFKVPAKPKELVFNDLESVLCEVKYEKWKK